MRVIGVRFKKMGKIYFFNPEKWKIKKGDKVIVDTTQGIDIGEVEIENRILQCNKSYQEIKPIIRVANKEDLKQYEHKLKKEKEAFDICNEKIKEYKLRMNLTDVEYRFDNSKLLFYFTSDIRVDFRDLVKDLASIFKTRIELRQIGVRDEVKRIGGNGICGRELCCCSFLGDFETVSIKMAKEQNLSLNPSKISGNCGRLMCCLKYEQEVYEEKLSRLPTVGTLVGTPEGNGIVENVEILNEIISVKIGSGEESYYRKYNVKDVKILKKAEYKIINEEENEHKKELEELEELEKKDMKNREQ